MFEEIVVTDNVGNRLEASYFVNNGGGVLYENMFGKDTNMATKDLPNDKFCELCGKHDEACRMCSGCRRVRYCGSECQNSHWQEHRENCKVACEVIITYTDRGKQGQDIKNVYMKSDIDQQTFVRNILDTIPVHSENLHDLHHLMKLSTCVYRRSKSLPAVFAFQAENNGKYFFNKISPGPGTKKWERFLKEYILSKQ
jgi:hypothetical protein